MNMFKCVVFILLSFWHANGVSQVKDYLKIRDEVKQYDCGVSDKEIVREVIRNMLALDTNSIRKNIHVLYEDLGQAYFLLSSGEEKEEMLHLSIAASSKALYYKPTSTAAMWNLSLAYILLGDCVKAKEFMQACKDNTKPKHWYPYQEERLSEICD